MDWEKALRELQDEMAIIDIHLRAPPNAIQFLVKQHKAIRLRMDANLNHKIVTSLPMQLTLVSDWSAI